MKKLLAISYCFPPVASPEAYVSAKLMGAMSQFAVDVISADSALFPNQPDHSLDQYVKQRFGRIERISAPELLRRFMLMPRIPLRPDRYILLRSLALQRALTMNPARYDAILTRSQYHSSHLVGLALKRRFPKLPWVASFSDPWTGGIYERNVPILSAISAWLEKAVFSSADGFVFPTRELQDFVARLHPDIDIAGRSEIIPHGYDPGLYSPAKIESAEDPIRIRMFGSFYGPRSPQPLLKALNVLTEQPGWPAFCVEAYGRNGTVLLQALKDYPRLQSMVHHRGELDHVSALSAMADADILMMIDAPMPPPSIFMPSKLADYIGARRPILAITPAGAAANIVRQIGGQVADPQEPESIAEALKQALLQSLQRSHTNEAMDASARRPYLVANLARHLENAVERVIVANA
jgi:glycosyltransferase involved in cell wall biosynthesis